MALIHITWLSLIEEGFSQTLHYLQNSEGHEIILTT
jgi:hypothetical protein